MMGISSRWLVVSVALVCACRIEVDDGEAEQGGQVAAELGAEGGGILVPDGAYRAEPPCPTALCPGQREGAPAIFPVDQYPQLLVLDPQTLRGPRARNANPPELAPLSFRAQMTWLAGAREPFDFTRSWLAAWSSASRVGPAAAPVTPRPRVTEVLHDGWLSAAGVPASGADAGAAAAPPSWSVAPFELIAVVNRVDLAAEACSGPAGELRYVYVGVDPRTSEVLDLTLILEVPYPTTRHAADWARDWQELAERAPAERPQALAELALAVQQAADPLRARLRSNEVALAEKPEEAGWELREFQLAVQSGTLALVPAPLEFTPRADVDPALLSQHVLAHADEIRSGAVSLPEALRAGAATTSSEDFSWPVLGVSEGLRQAFSRETCNGCHGGDTRTLPFRHIGPSPDLQRPAKLSRFLYDPSAATDELRRRAARMEELGATFCEPPAAEAGGYYGP